MNRFDGERLNEVFFKYYLEKEIENLDKIMLDRLVRAGLIEYVLKEGKAYAQATSVGKGLHYLSMSAASVPKPS